LHVTVFKKLKISLYKKLEIRISNFNTNVNTTMSSIFDILILRFKTPLWHFVKSLVSEWPVVETNMAHRYLNPRTLDTGGLYTARLNFLSLSILPTQCTCICVPYGFTINIDYFPIHRWRSWLRHCATRRKIAGSIPDGVIEIFHLLNPSGYAMAPQPLT
jgi:hypothetical protein